MTADDFCDASIPAGIDRRYRGRYEARVSTTRCEQNALLKMATPAPRLPLKNILSICARKWETAPAWPFWLKKRIRPRGKEFAANWRKCSRVCVGAFMIRCGAKRKILPPKLVSATICASFRGSNVQM